jgi:aminopeptidase N
VTIDPRYLIAAPIVLTAPADMLKNLLTAGERARTRRMAAMALGKRQDPDTVAALSRCLSDQKEAWMVRAKAAESLGKILGSDAEEALLLASATPDPKVRRAVASALARFRTPATEAALTSLTEDPSYLVTAAAARALGESQSQRSAPLLKGLLKKSSWSEVVRSAAVSALADLGDEAHVPTLIEWTKYGKPLRARRTAISALSKAGEGKKVRDHLSEMLNDRDPHVRSSVLSALGTLGDQKATGAIHTLLERELDGSVRTRARDVLTELKKSGLAGLKEAQKENEKLSREMAELKARLVKLEQLSGLPDKPSTAASKKRSAKKTVSKRSKA